MPDDLRCRAIDPASLPERSGSGYPEPFRVAVAGRKKRALGDPCGLTQFGANLVELPPGCWSSQRHWHSHQDELVYVVSGELVLVTDAGEQVMRGHDRGLSGRRAQRSSPDQPERPAGDLHRDRLPDRRGRGGLRRHRHGTPPTARGRPCLRAQERRTLLRTIRREAT